MPVSCASFVFTKSAAAFASERALSSAAASVLTAASSAFWPQANSATVIAAKPSVHPTDFGTTSTPVESLTARRSTPAPKTWNPEVPRPTGRAASAEQKVVGDFRRWVVESLAKVRLFLSQATLEEWAVADKADVQEHHLVIHGEP